MAAARIIIILVAIAMATYLGHQLTRFGDFRFYERALLLTFVFLLVASTVAMPLFFWSDEGREWLSERRWVLTLSYYGMALFSGLIAFVILRDFYAFAANYISALQIPGLYSRSSSYIIVGLSVFLVFLGWLKVKGGVQVEKVEVPHVSVSSDLDGYKIVQISDLHISDFVPKEFIEGVIAAVNAQEPDLIALTGDIIDGDTRRLADKISLLRQLRAKSGVFYVHGNHEHYWNAEDIEQVMREFGFRVLVNEAEAISIGSSELLVSGVQDVAARMNGLTGPDFKNISQHFRQDQFRLLLAHQPGVYAKAKDMGFHLQLSGHTHGGQFFPWNFMIGLVHRYHRGLYEVGDMHLYVSQGTAYWGPAVRFGTICEVSVQVLRSKDLSQ